jgi:hypothetical protein
MDDAVRDATVFTKNRERLIAGLVSQRLLESVLVESKTDPEVRLFKKATADKSVPSSQGPHRLSLLFQSVTKPAPHP